MHALTSVGIAKRLYAVIAVVALALLGVAAFATLEMGVVIRDADRVQDQRVPQMQRAAALELDVTRVSLQLRHAMLSRTPEELAATLADIGKL